MPTAPATIYNKGGTDKTCIFNTRAYADYPFDAPNWLDLRVGFLLSLTQVGAPDTIGPPMAEDLGAGGDATNQFWIGVRNRGTTFPGTTGVVFIGYTDSQTLFTTHNAKLISSDAGVGTTNSNYWRATNIGNPNQSEVMVLDGVQVRSAFPSVIHYAQANIGGAGPAGYATLVMLQLTRERPVAQSAITVKFKGSIVSPFTSDVLFTSTPTLALLQANLSAFPTTGIVQLGPFNLSSVPDALWMYWPFQLSRLRVHACGFIRAR